jgi:hypothetical protein
MRTFGARAFESCSSLRTFCIPSSVETISNGCFGCCGNLSEVTFEAGGKVSTLGGYAFCIPSSVETRQLPFLHQSVSFRDSVSVIARISPNLSSSPAVALRNLMSQHFCAVSHFNRSIFHRPLKSYRRIVSRSAAIFRMYRYDSRRVAKLRLWMNQRFTHAHHLNRFIFRHQ